MAQVCLQHLTKQHPLAELIFLPCASERLLVHQIVRASVNNGASHRWQFAHPSTRLSFAGDLLHWSRNNHPRRVGGQAWRAGAKSCSRLCITTPSGLGHISGFQARKSWKSASSSRFEFVRSGLRRKPARNLAYGRLHAPAVLIRGTKRIGGESQRARN
jgi:hypothetical protein